MPRTWLITGADKGLGLSTAEAVLAQGDNVVVTVLAADGRHPLQARHPDRFRALHLDARDQAEVKAVAAQAIDAFGRIDVLVNNAGYGVLSVIEETDAAQYRPLFEVNFFAAVEMTQAILPTMRRQRAGHIINLSSHAGFIGSPGFGLYSAAKFAVEGFSEALSKEVAHLGIRVTVVEPGGFRSDFAGPSLQVKPVSTIEDYEAARDRISSYVATRHGTQPNDPAKFGPAVCRLAALDSPPIRLPLGADALQFIRDEIASVSADLDRWEDLSRSTSVDQ